MAASFGHPVDVSPIKLRIEPFLETQRVRSFDCGNADLNDFLNTEEVENYEKEGLGRTYLVFYDGDAVAYFTISSDGLRVEYLKKWSIRRGGASEATGGHPLAHEQPRPKQSLRVPRPPSAIPIP